MRTHETIPSANRCQPADGPRMPAQTLDFKIAFLEGLLSQFGERPIRILDMGCGTAKDWPGVLRSRPWVTYVNSFYTRLWIEPFLGRLAIFELVI